MLYRIAQILVVILMICLSNLRAQSETVTIYPIDKGTIEKLDSLNGKNYGYYDSYEETIGRRDDRTFRHYYRTWYLFALDQIPLGARINSCTLYVYISSYYVDNYVDNNKAKIIKLPEYYSPSADYWSEFDNSGTVYYVDIKYDQAFVAYSSNSLLASDVQTCVNTTSNRGLTIGILSQNEGNNNSYAHILGFYITVSYTPRISVTIQNSFNGGKLEIDGSLTDSPCQLIWYSGDTHWIRAYTQQVGCITYPFPEPGTWWCSAGTGKTQVNNNTPVSITPNSDCTYRAEFGTPKAAVIVRNSFGGGTIIVDNVNYSSGSVFNWEIGSTHILRADTQYYNGKLYPLKLTDKWKNITTNQVYNQNPCVVTIGGCETYEAQFEPAILFVTVTQKLSNDILTSAGIGYWEGGPDFREYSIPKQLNFQEQSTQCLRGSQSIESGEKYKYWKVGSAVQSDVTNHHIFTIASNDTIFTSQFAPTHPATIQAQLIDGGSPGGYVEFKDPWLIDYPDPQYGNNLRNQGMSAPFKSVAYDPKQPNLGLNTQYKGVFLNQDYNIPNNPYYSVRAPQEQMIGNYKG